VNTNCRLSQCRCLRPVYTIERDLALSLQSCLGFRCSSSDKLRLSRSPRLRLIALVFPLREGSNGPADAFPAHSLRVLLQGGIYYNRVCYEFDSPSIGGWHEKPSRAIVVHVDIESRDFALWPWTEFDRTLEDAGKRLDVIHVMGGVDLHL